MRLTPGAYLKHRRQAAGLSVADVAARITTEPRSAEHQRGEWLELIEADAAPMTLTTIVALARVVPFDVAVLFALEDHRQGVTDIPLPRICRICACSNNDPCRSAQAGDCHWHGEDLCSAHGPCEAAVTA